MNYERIIRRAWHIVWRYRVLWLFGFVLALTTGGGAGFVLSRDSSVDGFKIDLDRNYGYEFDFDEDLPFQYEEFKKEMAEVPSDVWNTVIGITVSVVLIVFIWLIVAAFLRYMAEAATIHMVDDYAETGRRLTLREGLRYGKSRVAWRLFLLDMIVRLPAIAIVILLFLGSMTPLVLWLSGSLESALSAGLLTAGLFFTVVLFAAIGHSLISWLMQFFRRVLVLEGQGLRASIRQGYQLVRQNTRESLITGLIVFAIGIVSAILTIPVFILTLPLIFLFTLAGLVLGGLPGLLLGGLSSLFLEPPLPYIIGAGFGVPVLFTVALAPLFFTGGLVEAFRSAVWTLAFRELRGNTTFAPEVAEISKTADSEVGEAQAEEATKATDSRE